MNSDPFFSYARERYNILLRRRGGQHAPWTADPVLQKYRFCNVFREDDRTTEWFKLRVRDPLRHRSEVIFATIAFRWFNKIETCKILHQQGLLMDWDQTMVRTRLHGIKPLITGAYMIKTPAGMTKLEGLIDCINNVWEDRHSLVSDLRNIGCLQKAHERLMVYPYLGSFMAYEVVTDLRHTTVLGDVRASAHSWAAAGPGCARGLSRLCSKEGRTDLFRYTSASDQRSLNEFMQELLEESLTPSNWPREWPTWEMREVEHTLCEFDKYERARLGQGAPKQLYRS
jgi:hypothetical protein